MTFLLLYFTKTLLRKEQTDQFQQIVASHGELKARKQLVELCLWCLQYPMGTSSLPKLAHTVIPILSS